MDLKEQAKEVPNDWAFFPIRRPMLHALYKTQRSMRWVPQEVDLEGDDLEACDPGIQKLVKGLLAFFVPSDGIVTENILTNFRSDTGMYKEASAFYAEQVATEVVHSEMYGLMAKALLKDEVELDKVLRSVETNPVIERIAGFATKNMERKVSLPLRIVAFACIEEVLFGSSFAAVWWIKKNGVLRGFCKANEFIARDEALHTKFACELFKLVCAREDQERPSRREVVEVISEAVDVSTALVEHMIPEDLPGLTKEDLVVNTKFAADLLLKSLGYEVLYDAKEPPLWMRATAIPNKTNFFEAKVTEYALPSSEVVEVGKEVEF